MIKYLSFSVVYFYLFSTLTYGAITYFSILNYFGISDNPFVNNSNTGVVYVENFETQFPTASNNLTTPHASGWNGGTTGGAAWGVKEDYATSVEGSWGWAWSGSVGNPDWTKSPQGIHFDFSLDADGRLPEYVGAALLGYNDFENVGGLYNSIFVYDKDGNEVTGEAWKLPRPHYTEADRDKIFTDFEGIYVPGGISRIQFRDFSYVDHLTYGYAPIPEPGTISLAGVVAVGLLRRRARAGL